MQARATEERFRDRDQTIKRNSWANLRHEALKLGIHMTERDENTRREETVLIVTRISTAQRKISTNVFGCGELVD